MYIMKTLIWTLIIVAILTLLTGIISAQSYIDLKQAELETTKEETGAYKQELYDGYAEVHVYETPKQEYGYQIIEHANGSIISTGYGVEAKDRTYTVLKQDKWVSSTSTDEKVI